MALEEEFLLLKDGKVKMLENLLKEAEGLVKQLIEQYRGQFQKEYDSIKASIQSMIDEVLDKFEQKIVANEKEARETFEKEILSKLEELSQRLTKIEEDNFKFKKDITTGLKQIENSLGEQLEVSTSKENISKIIEDFVQENPKQIRKSFFNFKRNPE